MAMEVLQSGMAEQVEFTPCSVCGRTFNPEVLARHEKVCTSNQKNAHKRPVFDTAKKRMEGTDLQSFLASRPYLKHKKPSTAEMKAAERKKNWKRKHEDFISSIRCAKDYTEAEAAGKSLPPPRPSQPNPDYVQCPYCARRFEEYAAERHIPFCKDKHNRLERRSNQGNKAMEKLNKRIQYKPPKLRKKPSDQDTPKQSSNPPGYHLVARNSNFSGTYSIDDGPSSPEKWSNYDQSTYNQRNVIGGRGGGHTVRGSVSKTSTHTRTGTSTHTSATLAGDLPGSSSNPWMSHENVEEQESLSDDKPIRRRRSQLKTPQPVANGVRRARQIRGMSENDAGRGGGGGGGAEGGHYSSTSSFGGDATDGLKLGPVKPRGKPRGPRVREGESPPPREETRFDYSNGFGSGSAGGDMRSGSGSSIGGRKGVPMNQHGMAMGKFCYECGARYPVPQAKYCCECGTKRI